MATITITTPTAQDARIQAAFGDFIGSQQPATGAQVKQAIITWMIEVVRRYEYQQQVNTVAQPDPITPT